MDMMKKRDKELTVPRSVAIATLIITLVCVLAMARHTDREIKQAKQEAQEAEARSADAILKLIKAKKLKAVVIEPPGKA